MNLDEGKAFLGELQGIIKAGLDDIRPRVAGDNLTVQHGWPITVIHGREPEAREGRERVKGSSPIRFSGNKLIFEDSNNGDHGQWQSVVGSGWRNGVAEAHGMRQRGGGFLVWEFVCQAEDSGTQSVTLTWERNVVLRSYAEWQPSQRAAVRVPDYDGEEPLRITRSQGIVRQLCAHYTPGGEVTIYAFAPTLGANYFQQWNATL